MICLGYESRLELIEHIWDIASERSIGLGSFLALVIQDEVELLDLIAAYHVCNLNLNEEKRSSYHWTALVDATGHQVACQQIRVIERYKERTSLQPRSIWVRLLGRA